MKVCSLVWSYFSFQLKRECDHVQLREILPRVLPQFVLDSSLRAAQIAWPILLLISNVRGGFESWRTASRLCILASRCRRLRRHRLRWPVRPALLPRPARRARPRQRRWLSPGRHSAGRTGSSGAQCSLLCSRASGWGSAQRLAWPPCWPQCAASFRRAVCPLSLGAGSLSRFAGIRFAHG